MNVGSIRLTPRHDEVQIRVGKSSFPLRYLKFHELRAFADALHDLADDIDREKRGTP